MLDPESPQWLDKIEARPRAEHPWSYRDPCRHGSFSLARFVLLGTLFLYWTIGSVPTSLLLMKRPYGVQEASAIAYTAFVAFFTFAATRNWIPYMFTCPVVRAQASRLLWRHLGFLLALFVLQTTALSVRPNLPVWWNTESRGSRGQSSPFELALILLSVGLGFVQVSTNRRLLGRAHREFSP